MGTACHVKGGHVLLEAVERELEIQPGETTSDGHFDLQRVACLGCCALAPVIKINDDVHSQVKIAELPNILQQYE
jgi:NADH-quinone oxidoreductase subunit E